MTKNEHYIFTKRLVLALCEDYMSGLVEETTPYIKEALNIYNKMGFGFSNAREMYEAFEKETS